MATDWVSRVSSPIPNHNIYEAKNNIYPQNRLNKNSQNLNVQGNGYSFSNRTVSPKDHMRENVKRMREIQRASRQRQEESKQYRGPIKSTSRPSSCVSTTGSNMDQNTLEATNGINNNSPDTLRSYIDNSCRQGQNPNTSRDFLRAHEKTGPPLELTLYPLAPMRKDVDNSKISVPRASTAREVQLIRRDIDFVRANAYSAKSARIRRSPSADSLLISQNNEDEKRKQYKRGETPSYLIRRRRQLQEAEEFAIANQPDPDQPDGHRKLSEKERKSTLELLKATEKDMLTELGRLPIRTDTLKLRTIKQEIEHKLNELEEAIKIFSKPKVFVRIDT